MVAPVRTRAEFAALSRTRRRGRSGPVWVAHVAVPTPGGAEPQVAYAVGRSVGTAVVRNRVRRRLRAVIAQFDTERGLPSGLYLVGTRPDVVGLPFDVLRSHLFDALDRVLPEPA